MAKVSLIVVAVCLIAATLDVAWGACTCTAPTATCESYNTFITCLGAIDSTCTETEKSAATTAIAATKTLKAALGCSGVSGLMSSLGLVLTFSGLAYLLNNKK